MDNSKQVILQLLETHSSELMIIILFAMMMVTLFVLIPQIIRGHIHKVELLHQEQMKALDNGFPIRMEDGPTRAAGRTAMLVPIVVVICAGTVTCFLVAYRSDSLFAVSLAVWSVAAVVSLAAITGGVALIGRLAQLKTGIEDEEMPENPLEKDWRE